MLGAVPATGRSSDGAASPAPSSISGGASPRGALRGTRQGQKAKAGFVTEQLRAVDPLEAEIKRAKRRLDKMHVERQQKNLEVERRNARMAEHDAACKARYEEMTRDEVSEEELQKLAQTKLFRQQRDQLEGEEENLRALLLEEDHLERVLISNTDHLTLIGITVGKLYAESRRRRWEEEAKQEALRNELRMQERACEHFVTSHEEDRRWLTRDEAAAFKSITNEFQAKLAKVAVEERERAATRAKQAALDAAEAERAAQQRADDEVLEMERSFELRMMNVRERFAKAATPATTTATEKGNNTDEADMTAAPSEVSSARAADAGTRRRQGAAADEDNDDEQGSSASTPQAADDTRQQQQQQQRYYPLSRHMAGPPSSGLLGMRRIDSAASSSCRSDTATAAPTPTAGAAAVKRAASNGALTATYASHASLGVETTDDDDSVHSDD